MTATGGGFPIKDLGNDGKGSPSGERVRVRVTSLKKISLPLLHPFPEVKFYVIMKKIVKR